MFKPSVLPLFAAASAAVALAACDRSSPTHPSPVPCTYTLSTSSLSFAASGGTASVSIVTASHCRWTAVSDRAWMSISSGASGTGNGAVNVSLAPNSLEAARTGTLTIAGQTVSAVQEGLGACAVEISPTRVFFDEDPEVGNIVVTAPTHCSWSAVPTATWVTVNSGSPGTGNGSVGYAVERNRDTQPRTGTIVVGDTTFSVHQAGQTAPPSQCEYSVAPIEIRVCMSAPYSLTAAVTTQDGCTWTASSGAPWITVAGGHSGSGSGVISFRVSDNWEPPRNGVVMVRWPTASAGQNLQVAQAGCYYAVSTASISLAAAAGSGQFDVLQVSDPITCGGPTQNACVWSAEADVPWIMVTTTMPQVGDNPVRFAVAANSSTSPRTGRIAVRDKIVQITQAGR